MAARFWGVAAGTLALILCGCGREQHPLPAPASAEGGAVPPPAPRPTTSNAAYVADAGSIDLFIIRSSELALERSSSRRVRDYAEMLIEAHKGTSAQLSLAGRRLNLLPSAVLQPREQALLDELQQAPSFDANYVRVQRLIHQRALALHKNYAAHGDSPSLRPVAAAAVPIIERHLRMLAYL